MLLISEDPDEIMEFADRMMVMHDGAIVHQMPAAGMHPHEIDRHMPGHH